VLVEERLNNVAPGGTGETVCATVAIEHAIVATGDHVEVEVAEKVVDFGRVEMRCVPDRTKEAHSIGRS